MPEFSYCDLLPLGQDGTSYRRLTSDGVRNHSSFGRNFLEIEPQLLTDLTAAAMHDIAHLLRPAHLRQLRSILDDPQASANDRYVARDLLKNACIAAGGVLPMCQDTGTAIVMGKRGQHVLTDGRDEEHISRGVYDAYTTLNLRYSQLAPLTMWEEKNTGSNLPAQVEIYATGGEEYKFLFMAKGGGSANKSFLYQETKAVLNPARMLDVPRGEDPLAGHRRVPAVPPGHRGRRDQRRVRAEDRQVRVGQVPGHAARFGVGRRARVPGPRARGAGARHHPADRHRRAVRRQVLLPRRAGGPAAQARGVVPGRDRGVVLGRPAGAGQDHRRRGVPRAARDRPGAVPAGCGGGRRRGRRGRHRPEPADGRDPRRADQVPGAHPRVADRPAGRGQGHRPRQDRRTPGRGRAHARLPARSPGLLRGARQDAGRVRVRVLRADHGGADGLLRRPSSRRPAARWSCWPRGTVRPR